MLHAGGHATTAKIRSYGLLWRLSLCACLRINMIKHNGIRIVCVFIMWSATKYMLIDIPLFFWNDSLSCLPINYVSIMESLFRLIIIQMHPIRGKVILAHIFVWVFSEHCSVELIQLRINLFTPRNFRRQREHPKVTHELIKFIPFERALFSESTW